MKVFEYAIFRYSTVSKWLRSLNNNWKAAKYYQAGSDAGSYFHQVLGTKKN
jgi:hypothetical protein